MYKYFLCIKIQSRLHLRENCMKKFLNEGACTYSRGISLARFAECSHHAGSTVEANAADKV